MQTRELSISGAFELTPTVHTDDRGAFVEWFRADAFESVTGHRFALAQANCSVSAVGSVRGIHFAQLPPSQAKYVTCLRGAILDVVVDIRVGSPTYGRWEGVMLDDSNRRCVYLSEGLGHAFMALDDDTVVSYLCSTPYAPGSEHAINALDPAIGIEWPSTGRDGEPLMHLLSPKDRSAPTLEDVRREGLLPDHGETMRFVSRLRRP
jgi:dTDP-4-dehydrorhamnose 3,5-epimerase